MNDLKRIKSEAFSVRIVKLNEYLITVKNKKGNSDKENNVYCLMYKVLHG